MTKPKTEPQGPASKPPLGGFFVAQLDLLRDEHEP